MWVVPAVCLWISDVGGHKYANECCDDGLHQRSVVNVCRSERGCVLMC